MNPEESHVESWSRGTTRTSSRTFSSYSSGVSGASRHVSTHLWVSNPDRRRTGRVEPSDTEEGLRETSENPPNSGSTGSPKIVNDI